MTLGDHSHGTTYGIFVSGATTGVLDLYAANDGTTFGSSLATSSSGGSLTSVDISDSLTIAAGDRQVRIKTTGSGVLARVKVLVILDLLIKVDPNQ